MSQYGEHSHILDYFGSHAGRFLDVGAFDGVTFSNTRPLAELGWSGVCVEPNPPAFCALMRAYAGNERVQIVNAGLAPNAKLKKFYSNTEDAVACDMLSSFSEEHRIKCDAYPFREIWIPAIDWSMLLEVTGHYGGFDFVNIDVEGTNVEILAAMPFHLVQPKMLCIEMDPMAMVPWMSDRLMKNGLGAQKIIGGNLLAARPK